MRTNHPQAISDALYELGVMTDILRTIAHANISGDRAICGTHVDWFAVQLDMRHERIEVAVSHLTEGQP